MADSNEDVKVRWVALIACGTVLLVAINLAIEVTLLLWR